MTESQIRFVVNGKEELDRIAREVSIAVAIGRKTIEYRDTAECFNGYSISGDTVEAFFVERRCGCCSPDSHYVEFPLEYLWQEDFILRDKAIQETLAFAARIQKAVDEANERKRQEEAQEARDKAAYERLKAKYEA